MKNQKHTRINYQIKAPIVRVIQDGNQLGVMPIDKANKMAFDAGLDLIEVVAHSQPPVCQIMDFEKFRYQQKQKEKEQLKKQKEAGSNIKQIRLRPRIQDHDIEIKVNSIKKFLADKKRVQVFLQFKNREIAHKEEGFRIINKIISMVEDCAVITQQPKMEGTNMVCRFECK